MCAKRGGVAPERAVQLDVLGRVRKMIFAANDVRDFHLDVVDHVDEMKNPGAVRPAHGHVRMRSGIGQIEIDLAADEIVDNDVFARRTKAQRSGVFEKVTGLLQLPHIAFINFRALTLKIRAEISTGVRTFIPIETEPAKPIVNGAGRFLGIARAIRVFNPQHQCPAGMLRVEPVERAVRAPPM